MFMFVANTLVSPLTSTAKTDRPWSRIWLSAESMAEL